MPTPSPSGLVLALGGGGARGLAHLGVLQVLEREGIPVRAIAGTSMGGLLGALYAAGIPLATIEETIAESTKPIELLSLLGLGKSGVSVRGQKLYELLVAALGREFTFDELRIPCAVMTVDLKSGRRVMLDAGDVADAVRATIAIPGVFEPVEKQGPGRESMLLIDGGVLDNVPVDAAASLAGGETGAIVAVDVLPHFHDNHVGEPPIAPQLELGPVPQVFAHLFHTAMIAIAELTELRLRANPPALVLRPEIPSEIAILSGFDAAEEVIAAGRRAAEGRVEELRRIASGG
jgi:NTE family protein